MRLDLATFLVPLQRNPTRYLNPDAMLSVAARAFTEIAKYHSSTLLSGRVHSVISTQFVDGAPLTTIENIFIDAAQSINRVTEIRDWYINKVSQEAEASGFQLSPSHLTLYRESPANASASTGLLWTGPKTWLPEMRNLYFEISSEATVSVRSFANHLNDQWVSSTPRTGLSQSQVPRTTSTLLPQPQNIVSTGISRLDSSVSHSSSDRKRSRRIVNCDGCGCGEYNCDSCWCQCENEDCNGPHPENQFENDDTDEEDEEEGDEGEDEDEDESDVEALYGPPVLPRRFAAVNCRGCGCGNPRCSSCY